jgi:hypothetical protein
MSDVKAPALEVLVRIADGSGGYREEWRPLTLLLSEPDEAAPDYGRLIRMLKSWREGDADAQRAAWSAIEEALADE